MNHDTQIGIARRILRHLDEGTTDYAQAEMRVPASHYCDQEHAAREARLVFRTHPSVAAHASELRAPGDFVTRDLLGTPVLLVRQQDGTVRAFANVCRHRGARVVGDASGCKRAFSCPYHGWSYGADGGLLAIPHGDGFPDIDRARHGLVRLAAGERHGIVWVMPSPGEELDIAAYLGTELDAELSLHALDGLTQYRAETYAEAINWKVCTDGFLDAYHVKFVHARSFGRLLHNNVYALDRFGPHARLVMSRRTIDEARTPDGPPELFPHAIVIYLIAPNSLLLVSHGPTRCEVWTILPDLDRPDRCTATLRVLLPELPSTDSDRSFWERRWTTLVESVRNEDWQVARQLQAGIGASGITEFVYGRNEAAAQHFHGYLAEVMRQGGGTR